MLFVFFILAGLSMQACICEVSSYYLVEMPEAIEEDSSVRAKPQREFKVYWNVPTMQCKSKKIPFDNLHQFGIIQNEDDNFRQGDKMTILYDPGFFPAMFNSGPGAYRYRNGGVPQEGNVQKHQEAFNISVEEAIPNKDYNGIAVIDFESWKPIFLQNYGTLKPYIDASYEIERKEHWWWPQDWIKNTAQDRYERAARIFMESTLKLAKEMRPKATWGYYAYPYCYNRGVAECSVKTMKENDRLSWLWNESTGVFPSVYTNIAYSPNELQKTARGAVEEAARVSRGGVVLPYISYVYRDQRSSYYKQSDLEVLLDTIYNSKAGGVVVWGASSDVNTKKKCELLLDYITNTFGPMIAQFTKGDRRRATETTTNASIAENATQTNDILITTENTTLANELTTEIQTEAFSEPSYQLNTTQIMQNESNSLKTNRELHNSFSEEVVLNSMNQFFDMAETNSSINETVDQTEFTPNPDDTPSFTYNEIEQEIKTESDKKLAANSASTISVQKKETNFPTPFAKCTFNWRNINATTPIADSTNTILEIVTDNSSVSESEFYTHRSTIVTDIDIKYEITTNVINPLQQRLSDNIFSDKESDSNEILASFTNLTGNLDEYNTAASPATIKNIYDEELANATKILQYLTSDGNQDSIEQRSKIIVDNNQSNVLKNFYDLATIEDPLGESLDGKTVDKYGQEMFEDDTILEAVADILNSTYRTEDTSS